MEDDARDREWLSHRLEKYLYTHHIIHTLSVFVSGEEFIHALQSSWFDIVFTDIYMSGITGIESAQILRSKDPNCKLVFLTSSEDYMHHAFSLNSAHYLLKPVKDRDFLQAMENCQIKKNCQVPFLDLTFDRKNIRVNTLDILYLSVENRMTMVHTKKASLPAGRNFTAVAEPLLKDERFLLCNKGILVNMDFVAGLQENDFVLVTGQRLPSSSRRRAKLATRYHSYIFGSLEG